MITFALAVDKCYSTFVVYSIYSLFSSLFTKYGYSDSRPKSNKKRRNYYGSREV